MNSAKQAVWVFVFLISLAASGWYFSGTAPSSNLDEQSLSNTNDAELHNLSVSRYNEQGKLVNLLKTPHLRHIPKENTNFIETPHIIISQSNQPEWEINAKKAKAIHGGEKITFIDNVIVHQKGNKNTLESTLITDKVTYFTNEHLATTTHEVTFKQPGNVVHAKGMKAYLAEKKIQLLSKAHGIYEPKHG